MDDLDVDDVAVGGVADHVTDRCGDVHWRPRPGAGAAAQLRRTERDAGWSSAA